MRMNGFRNLCTCSVLALMVAASSPLPARADQEPLADTASWIPRHFQIEVASGCDIQRIATDHGLDIIASLDDCHLLASSGEMGDDVYLFALQNDLRIRWAEPAYRQQTPESARQMVVAVVGGTVDEFTAQNVYDRLSLGTIHELTRGQGVIVAVIDTGIDRHHPALLGRFTSSGFDFVDHDGLPWETANGRDDDEDGAIDEGAGHGTMVAGIVSLVAPDARILPIRALDDDGNGTAFGVAQAIHFAIEQDADVINLSLGLTEFSMVIDRALRRAAEAGIVVVAAAGNEGTNDPPYYPASSPFTVSVASVGGADIKSDFSNYHETVNVSAPGESILAPFLDGQWAVGSGTSFAAPFVSGQAALVQAAAPFLGKSAREQKLEQGTVRIDGIIDNIPYRGMLGSGRFDGRRTWEHLEASTSDLLAITRESRPALRWAPNPAPHSGHTTLELGGIPVGAEVSVALHDATGRILRTIEVVGPGDVTWDARDDGGEFVAAGLYFARVRIRSEAGEEIDAGSSRVLLLR